MELADILTSVGTVLSSMVSWMSTLVTWITSNPLVLIWCLFAMILVAFSAVSKAVKGY